MTEKKGTRAEEMPTTNKKEKEAKIMKTNIESLVNALEELTKSIKIYLMEETKCAIGIPCYKKTCKESINTQDLYDGIQADPINTRTNMIDAYLNWNRTIQKFNRLMTNAALTPEERTVLVLRYLSDKPDDEIMEKTGYQDVDALDALLCNEEVKTITIIPENPVKDFLAYILPKLSINIIPWELLNQMYQAWARQTYPDIMLEYEGNKNLLAEEIRRLIHTPICKGWNCTEKDKMKRITKEMKKEMKIYDEEPLFDIPLLDIFHCTEWTAKLKQMTHIRGMFRD